MVTPAMARRIRKAVMDRMLGPLGFVETKGWRRRDFGIYRWGFFFQGSQWGGGTYVNVGVHYDFLPPLALGTPGDDTTWSELDFLIWTRVDQKYDGGRSIYSIREERDEVTATFEQAGRAALCALETITTRLGEPAAFLDSIPPEVARTFLPPFESHSDDPELREQQRRARFDAFYAACPGGTYDPVRIGLGLAGVALHLNRRAEAEEYAAILRASTSPEGEWFKRLNASIDRVFQESKR